MPTSTPFCASYDLSQNNINTNPPQSNQINHDQSKMQLTSLFLTTLPLLITTIYALPSPNPDGANTFCLGACAKSDAELQCAEPYVRSHLTKQLLL